MTNEELQEMVEAQNATINDLKTQLTAKDTAIEEAKKSGGNLNTEFETLKKKVEELTPVAAEKETLTKTVAQLKEQLFDTELKRDYPDIGDWSVVGGKDQEERKANAKKISDMIQSAAKAAKGNGAPDKTGAADGSGERWKAVPAGGLPTNEAQAKTERMTKINQMTEKAQKGDTLGVFDSCLELQPEATKGVFGSR